MTVAWSSSSQAWIWRWGICWSCSSEWQISNCRARSLSIRGNLCSWRACWKVMCRHQTLLSLDGYLAVLNHTVIGFPLGLIISPSWSRNISSKQLDYFTVGALCDWLHLLSSSQTLQGESPVDISLHNAISQALSKEVSMMRMGHLAEQTIDIGTALDLGAMPNKEWTDKVSDSKAVVSLILRVGALHIGPSSSKLAFSSSPRSLKVMGIGRQ